MAFSLCNKILFTFNSDYLYSIEPFESSFRTSSALQSPSEQNKGRSDIKNDDDEETLEGTKTFIWGSPPQTGTYLARCSSP